MLPFDVFVTDEEAALEKFSGLSKVPQSSNQVTFQLLYPTFSITLCSLMILTLELVLMGSDTPAGV